MSPQGLSASAYVDVVIPVRGDLSGIVVGALNPEAETPSSERSHTIVEPTTYGIRLRTEASDLSALRAALNSYLRWVEGILDIVEKVS